MRSRKERKEEWLEYCGWHYSADERWFRDKIAKLFDLETPNESQQRLLFMADLRLTLFDLPDAAYPTHEAELKALLVKEFGPPPSERGWRWLLSRFRQEFSHQRFLR